MKNDGGRSEMEQVPAERVLARLVKPARLAVLAVALGLCETATAQLTAGGAIQPFSPFDATGILQQATFGTAQGPAAAATPWPAGRSP